MQLGRVDQRLFYRVACDRPVRMHSKVGNYYGTCENLSIGGLFFTSSAPEPVEDQPVDVTLLLPNSGELRLQGEVRNVRSSRDGTGIGIRFTRLQPEQMVALHDFLATQAA